MDQKLVNKLNNRVKEGTLRSLSFFDGYTDFFSNDYLGFSSEKGTSEVLKTGSSGSRLISGNSLGAIKSEQAIADFFNVESALMFNSGYDANVGFFSSVPQRGDLVLYDELIHASVRDGLRMSFAKFISFKHNDIEDLKTKLEKFNGVVYVAVEGLYSMDGDIAPLRNISDLCQKYGAYLVVDEAHSAGVFGRNGKGLTAAIGLEKEVFARLITFGKSYGSHGAAILGTGDLTQFLVNFSRAFIYTTALPEYVYKLNAERAISDSIGSRQQKLHDNLSFFRSNFFHEGLISEVNSPIQVLQIGDIEEVNKLSVCLQSNKIAVKPIFSPTVAKGKERLRLCFHASNTIDEIQYLIDTLGEVC
ncbi:MAG: pyridoxal phosphate-dependent aminotransferase family protein [Crocinitomicaceae bacterium]|nr:pyridoxal phosphate-dependent aminotransferase family protein [Crocinitomicaceae bacterium]